MTSSLFESFSSQNFPSNPTVPPSAPPGFSAPSSVANPASTSPPMTSAQITALQNALQDNNLQQVVQAVTGAYVPSTGSSFDQLEVWAQSLDNGAQNIENLISTMLGIPPSAWGGVNEMLAAVEAWAKQLDGGIQQMQTWWNSLLNGVLGGSGTNSVFDLSTWLQNLEGDLTTLESDATASTAAFAALLTSWESAITGYTNWSTFIAALEAAWTTYSTTESGLTSSAIFTLQNLFNTLLGISPSTGQMTSSNVSSVLSGSSLGSDVSATHTTAANGTAWATRLTNDLLVLSDVFHLTYAIGTSTDPPGTTSGGKPTWYSCWNDLLALCGIVNSTTAPTDIAPTTGASITAASAAATTAGTNASIAISSASAANTLAQGTIDGLNTAWSAGGTGNPVTTIPTIAAAIPTSAIVGGAGAAVAFGAVGGGNAVTGSTSSISTSWTHVIATGDLGVLVGISYTTGTGTVPTASVTYGGTSMTLLYSQLNGAAIGGNVSYQAVFWLKSPASGSKTVSVSLTASANIVALYGNSMSYSGSKVASVGNYSGGGSTGLSMTAASVTGNMVVGFFTSYVNNNNVLSSFSQTERYNHGYTTVGMACDFGDAAGASSVVFTASSPYSTQQWAGVTVELSN